MATIASTTANFLFIVVILNPSELGFSTLTNSTDARCFWICPGTRYLAEQQ
jgi:hypothetical protein